MSKFVLWCCLPHQVAALIPMADDFATEDFCTVVFDEFFFTNINRENVMRHVIKLVWYIHPKLPPARLDTLQKALQPGPHQVHHSLWTSLLPQGDVTTLMLLRYHF